LNKKLTAIAVGSITISLLLLLLAAMIMPTYADTPTEPHNADAMWVEPASVTFTPDKVGQKFNVTVALNMTEGVFGWQVKMRFNATQINCTRSGYTSVTTSNYFKGHMVTAPGAVIDDVKGTIVIMETCMGTDYITGPHAGTLIFAEFQVLLAPTTGNLTSKFDISTDYGTGSKSMTWVYNADGSALMPFTPNDGTYTIIVPEFSYVLMLPAFMALTVVAIIVGRRASHKKLK
jgi:hypothetical protein